MRRLNMSHPFFTLKFKACATMSVSHKIEQSKVELKVAKNLWHC